MSEFGLRPHMDQMIFTKKFGGMHSKGREPHICVWNKGKLSSVLEERKPSMCKT